MQFTKFIPQYMLCAQAQCANNCTFKINYMQFLFYKSAANNALC